MAEEKFELRLVSGMNFYEVSSAFQKCIRRGIEEKALWYATELWLSGYPDYVWNRMMIISSEDVGLADNNVCVQINALHEIYLKQKKKANKHQPERLAFVHAVSILARSKKSRLIDNKLCYYFELRSKVPVPKFDDFVYDMHTIQGRKQGRGNDHFYQEAGKIENVGDVPEEFEFRDKVWAIYNEIDAEKKRLKESQQNLF